MTKHPLALEHALLGLLWNRSMHAYEMHQTLTRVSELGLIWRLKQSQLYALLARLEEAGYITTKMEPQGSRPPRKVLHLTSSGRDAFRRWLLAPVEHGRDFRQEFLAKLYFAQEDHPETIATLVSAQRAACQEWLADLRAESAARSPGSFDWLVLNFRIGQVEAIVDWLDTCEATTAAPAPV